MTRSQSDSNPTEIPIGSPIGSPVGLTIRVALDSATASPRLVRAAVHLAAEMGAAIEGVLIEDINLIRLAALPFARLISPHSPTEELIAGARMERDLKVHARKIERLLTETALLENVESSFRIVRGTVEREIRAAAAGADLLAICGARRTLARRADSPDQAEILPLRFLRTGERAEARSRAGAEPRLVREAGSAGVWSNDDCTAVLVISCDNPSLREGLVTELIRQRGRRVIFLAI